MKMTDECWILLDDFHDTPERRIEQTRILDVQREKGHSCEFYSTRLEALLADVARLKTKLEQLQKESETIVQKMKDSAEAADEEAKKELTVPAPSAKR